MGRQSNESCFDEKATPTEGAASPINDKKNAILEACTQRDIDALKALAESPGGLLFDSIRQQAWPILLGLPSDPEKLDAESSSWHSLPIHKDEDQVQLDVNRAFIYYPQHQTEAQLSRAKTLLSDLIISVLRHHPYLSYFQGYHDIAQVLLLTLPPRLHASSLTYLSLFHIRDFMLPSLAPAIAQLRLLPQILHRADPKLWRHLSGTEPFFALSGTLTMYAHDVTTQGEIARLFDVLLARDPAFTVYLFAAIVCARRTELFDTPPDEPEMLHSILSKLPVPLDVEGLITRAVELERQVPPESLPAWRKGVSRWSVLKTGRDTDCAGGANEQGRSRGVEQGREWFEKQVRELEWDERKKKVAIWAWKNRRPAGVVGMTVLVAVLAVLLRKAALPSPAAAGLEWATSWVARWWR
ncbi:rab-GTPase-TBC domain-containing protein [Dichotomopilus funicola]|uniref:Rab-GTPase-TBC domain-containing protein n=1 Tax=Dichotomopilus funicola TaxID=1934379 RepID=A0AAN6V8D8_9PEZI|nr:rab-GTPase-TBC domain-containing protein [Dichotomopilus funicola]